MMTSDDECAYDFCDMCDVLVVQYVMFSWMYPRHELYIGVVMGCDSTVTPGSVVWSVLKTQVLT